MIDEERIIEALTIQLGFPSEKTINVKDLQRNAIQPLVLKQCDLLSTQRDHVREDEEEKKKTLAEWGIRTDGKTEMPSSKTLQAILELETRPGYWGELACRTALHQLNQIEESNGPPFSHLTVVDYDITSSADLAGIFPPHLLNLLWQIVIEPQWEIWPNEVQVRHMLSCLVSGGPLDFLSIPPKKSSSGVTFKIEVPSMVNCSRHYTPLPDTQVRVGRPDYGMQVEWLEVDSTARGADRCKMLLVLNSLAKAFALVPHRPETILLVGVYVNYDRSTATSTEITVFQIPPSKDNGPIQTFRYETGIGRFGASDFLNVMFKLLYRIRDCVNRDYEPFAIVQQDIKVVGAMIKAKTGGALAQTAESSEHSTNCCGPGRTGSHYSNALGDGGDRYLPGDGDQADSDHNLPRKRPRLDNSNVNRCDMVTQELVWVPLSPSSIPKTTSSDGELKEYDDAVYCLNSRSLASALQDIVNRLALPKLRGVLQLHRTEDDHTPFAMAKLASRREVDHTSHLQAIPGIVKVISHHPLKRTENTNLLLTCYAGPHLRWYCNTFQHLYPKVPSPFQVAKDLLATVQAVHDAGLAHLDIKPGNICVPDDILSSCHAILIDFGSSQRIRSRVHYPFGTVGWLAPEVERQEEDIDLRLVDVWATGKVLLNMCEILPQGLDGISLLQEVGRGLTAPMPGDRIKLVAARERLEV